MAPGARASRKTPAKPSSYFVDRLLNVPARLGLSKDAETLLHALDDVKSGIIEEVDLGRKIRLSPTYRQTIPDTINKCSETIAADPSESTSCVQIIRKCTEIMQIANRTPPRDQFPFLKLPIEIRHRIYGFIFGQNNVNIRQVPNSHLLCPSNKCHVDGVPVRDRLNTQIIQTSSRVRDEALPILYKHRTLSFQCACYMGACLRENTFAREHVSSIRFHWRGEDADKAIPRLMYCPNLRELCVQISKMTTHEVTDREKLMRTAFKGLFANVRLCDARGIDELLEIRGLDMVLVKHAGARVSKQRSNEDVWNLQDLLDSKLKLARTDGHGKPP